MTPKFSKLFPFLCSRLQGTVIVRIWWQCAFMILHTIGLLCLHHYVEGLQINFPLSLVRILAGPTGLLLVFRTNTAYDRYWEGRKIWGTMTYQIRSLTMSIILGVEEKDKNENENGEGQSSSPDDLDKPTVLNLLVAFVYATKNHLRGLYSYDENDIKDLICHIPRFKIPPTPTETDGKTTSIVLPMDQPQLKNNKVTPGQCQGQDEPTKMDTLKAHDFITKINVPLEIIYCLFSYLQILKIEKRVDAITMKCFHASILVLMDCLTSFERILKTPIPLAYSIHLKLTVWLFLLSLPYQFIQILNWWTIPTVLIASVTLLGILAIGAEIENPFGYDENDLPLDDFCNVIRREIQVMVTRSERAAQCQSQNQNYNRMAFTKLSKLPKI